MSILRPLLAICELDLGRAPAACTVEAPRTQRIYNSLATNEQGVTQALEVRRDDQFQLLRFIK